MRFSAKEERLEIDGEALAVEVSLRGVCAGVVDVEDNALVLMDSGLRTGERCGLGGSVVDEDVDWDVDMDPVREELIDDDDARSGRDCVCCGEVELAITTNLRLAWGEE